MTDDLDRQLAELDRQRRELLFRRAVTSRATALGFRDPRDAYRLLDPASVEYGPDGPKEKDVDRQLHELLMNKGYLADPKLRATGSGDGGRGNRAVIPPTDMNALLRKAAGRE